MGKTNRKTTDFQSFGKKSLRIIFSVLEDIKAKMEITQTNKNITVRYAKKVDDVSESERRHALDSLFEQGIIRKTKLPLSFSSFFRKNVEQELAVSVEVDISKFNKFYQKIEKCITPEEMKKINKDDISFDADNSLLFINDIEIKVCERKEKTCIYYILYYLFNDVNADNYHADYSELMRNDTGIDFKNIGNEKREKLFKKYYEACKNLNNKIHRQTTIQDFLIISGSRNGSIEINKEYRPSIAR